MTKAQFKKEQKRASTEIGKLTPVLVSLKGIIEALPAVPVEALPPYLKNEAIHTYTGLQDLESRMHAIIQGDKSTKLDPAEVLSTIVSTAKTTVSNVNSILQMAKVVVHTLDSTTQICSAPSHSTCFVFLLFLQ